MEKKLFSFVTLILLTFAITGCNTVKSDYQLWRESDDAEDLNGDRKINEADYELFINPPASAFELWHDSDDAEDLNGDRKIDEADYELFLNPPPSAYELWLESADANDLNDDTFINQTDYTMYLEFVQFVGTYHIENYTFEGDSSNLLGMNLSPTVFGTHLGQLNIEVDIERKVTIEVPTSTRQLFGENYTLVQTAITNMTLSRLSDVLIVLDTHVVYESIALNISLYFNKVGNKLTLTYSVYDYTGILLLGNMSFDVVKD